MDCRNFRKQIPEYNASELGARETVQFEKHLEQCTNCRAEVERFHEFERELSLVDFEIPQINIIKEVRASASQRKQQSLYNVFRDVIAAAAVAAVVFWFVSPFMLDNNLPGYTERLAQKSTNITNAVNFAMEEYIKISSTGVSNFTKDFGMIGSKLFFKGAGDI